MRRPACVRPAVLAFAALSASALAQTPPMEPQFQVSQDTLSYQSTYGVAIDTGGRFVVSWMNYNSVDHTDDTTVRLFDPSGTPQGNQFGVSASATDQFDGPVAKDASGRFMVVWFENQAVKGRRFQPDGTPIGSTFTVTDSADNDVFIASDDSGNFVVTWSRFVAVGPEFDVFARIYDSSGAPVGNEFPVNSYTTLQQQARGVARKQANGQFVITWVGFGANGAGVYARTFDAAGNPLTGEIPVNQGNIPTPLSLASVAMNGAGEFVVAWEGVTAPPNQGIFARQFDSKGQALGGQFPVASAGGTNDLRDPQVASDRAGNFLVTWTAQNGDGDADAIGARAYDRFGTATSSAFVVNEATAGSQYGQKVAMNDSGHFVIAWSTPDGSSYGVVARRSGVAPAAVITVDPVAPLGEAPGNGVIEPGDTVEVQTAWVNDTTSDLTLSGTATDFSGPVGATYTLDNATANYGTIPPSATGSCAGNGTVHIVNVGEGGTNFVDSVSGTSTSTIQVGDTIRWVWVAGEHSSTSGPCPPCTGDGTWDSGIQDNGTFEHTFDTAGNFPYFCIPHDIDMLGTVVVNNSAAAAGSCYQVTVSAPATRPVQHWDAQLQETLSVGQPKTWPLHIGQSFPDVPLNAFYPFIETLFHNNVTGGCAGGGYCPTNPVTRAQMAVFLLKSKFGSAHIPPPCTGTVFTDVPCTGGAFDPWIEELASLQITGGCGGGLYCPTNTVTRQQMAVFLLKALEGSTYDPPDCAGIFDDVPCTPGTGFSDWIEELANRGITGGCNVTPPLYCPTNPNNRGQMAVFLSKTFRLALYGP
jgi:plastocyanin